MQTLTIAVVGAGFAGIHTVKELRKTFQNKMDQYALRLILIDPNPYHLRKVLMFRPAVKNEDIRVPLKRLFPEGVELLQGTACRIVSPERKLVYLTDTGEEGMLHYDRLIIAAGSVIRQPVPELGGIALSSLENAERIRREWQARLVQAAKETDLEERERMLRIVIAGAGISGMETAAELAYYARQDAKAIGLDPEGVSIELYNAQPRLFLEGPSKVAMKLEHLLRDMGVRVIHDTRVMKERDGTVWLSDGGQRSAGLCIWTLGLLPNPKLRSIGLPVTPEGYVLVDTSYRVADIHGVYSIGDCARVVDPASGQPDGSTCKEAIPQAARLAKVILADQEGRRAPVHQSYMTTFCIGLGPDKGLTWVRKWGLDIVITGKLGWRIKQFTWDTASLL
ncbi:FAD-dependent oxidoreductase [Paenibacillus sp. PL2-23]|uniref:NAD(P)/FAD-dependent oxidoreductase n=1 Tax=Paenibacillus sp. PL2-23 TaxID=2100729 RepID=UPI0030F4D8EA